MSISVQRVVALIVGLICLGACFRKQFYGATIGGSTGQSVRPWRTRLFLLVIAGFFFWLGIVGIR